MSMSLVEFTEKLVPISDFSQGKAGKIFSDVAENNSEYIVLKIQSTNSGCFVNEGVQRDTKKII